MIWGENMGDITREKLNHFRKHHRIMRRYTAAFLAAAALVGCGVGWSLHQTGISATAEAFCGEGEHKHTEGCFEKVLICGLEEGQTLPTQEPHTHGESCYELQTVNVCGEEAHSHTDDCYTLRRDLTCGEEDHTHNGGCYEEIGGDLTCSLEEHTHGEDCLDEEGNLVCSKDEHTHNDGCYAPVQRVLTCTKQEHTHSEECYGEPKRVLICTQKEHTHADSCFEEKQVLVCTLPEGPQEPQVHIHSESCYEERLTCGKEEHTHTEQCLSDSTADVEGPDDWVANSGAPGTGNWAYDLYMVACAQMGYQESQRNFTLDDTGTRQGYTRYGAWYGDPYGSWNGMFVAYCLHFAGVPEDVVPQRAGINAMLAAMADSDHLMDPTAYTPRPGDIALFGDRIGIVAEPGETVAVICGDVDGKVEEVSVAASSVSCFIRIAQADAWENADAATLEGDTGTVDLGKYTTSVKLSYGNPVQEATIREDNSPEITLSDGDPVKIYINYRFPTDMRTDSAVYDMPDGITTTQVSGNVTNDVGETVGTFKIENGKINITYNDNAWEGQSTHTGYVYFEGKVDLSSTEDKKDISFPGAGKVTIHKKEEPKDYGHKLEKSVVKSDDNKTFQVQPDGSVKVTYKVTLTATGADGTGTENLTITDILNRTQWSSGDCLKASYDPDSFKLVKSGGEDNLLETGSTKLTIGTGSEGNPQAKIENLPPLTGKDDSYILTYDVTIPASEFAGNDVKSVKNWVKTDENHNAENSEARKDYKLQKGSSYNFGTGRITWTVTVNDPFGTVDDYKVWDELPENLQGKVTGDIRITDRNGQTVDTLSNGSAEFNNFFDSNTGYTFGTGSTNAPYKFTYETEAPEIPDGQTEATAKNTVKLTPKGEETITVVKEEKVDSTKWTTKKKQESVSGDMVFWSIQAENTLGSKHFTVTDTIINASPDPTAWNATFYPGTHYALQSELEEVFSGQYSTDGKGLYVVLEDGQGNTEEVTYGSESTDVTFTVSYTAAPETGAVTAFKIDVTSTDKKVKGIYLSAYPTHVDFSQTPDGSTWIFKNDLRVDKTETSDTFRYTKSTDFKKEVSTDGGTTWSEESGISEDVTLKSVEYGINYRIILSVEEGYSGDIVVTDKLPDGAEFINSNYGTYVDGIFQWRFKNQPTYDSSTNTVTFVITPQENDRIIVIQYRVNVTNDPDWENTLIGSKNYRNVASWGDKEAETNTLVKRYNTTLAKEAEQLKNSDGDPSNRIQYTVVINPNKEDLASGADSFTMEDTLKIGNNITGSLDPSSFKLYYFKDVGGTLDLSNNAPIIKLDWKASDPLHFSITVPNQTALVLRYVFEVNMSSVPAGTTTFDIQNEAKVGTQTSTSKKISIADQKAGGGFNGDKLQLIKKDKDSGLLISGARFKIRSFDSTSNTWNNVWEGDIPDGQKDFGISADLSVSSTVLQPGVLYSIQETHAPENYRLDVTPKYVIFSSDTDTGSVFQTAAGASSIDGTNGDTVTASNVTFLAKSGTSTLEFENQYTNLDIQKVWRDKNDNLIDAPVDSIQVQLKRFRLGQPESKENVGEPVTLEKAKKWAYSWSDLDAGYYYTVEEVLPEGWKVWKVSYANNGGIQTGLITITNEVSDEFTYELPKTGGTGTQGYVFFGTVAMILAGCGIVVTRKKRDTGVNEQ